MTELVIGLGWMGIFAPVAIGAIASAIGCGIAGQAGIGAMLDSDSGYGRYIGISAFPSTFVIYGTRLTGVLKNLNYADAHSPAHAELLAKIETLSASAP